MSRFPEKASNALNNLMPTDYSPSPDEIDGLETGSSVDDEHSRVCFHNAVSKIIHDFCNSQFVCDP
ncbi:hypothetical protein ANCCAN_07471 [Ancylostoma caninum]|uniref:Uncharacterized protein n=1 Tax=Ancylostoma caninum TaxID=29170 RepID=A0A368GS79_ANCCA|nr:hypothetical protein ANCCAN_07471 [Ancylostoma caninum]